MWSLLEKIYYNFTLNVFTYDTKKNCLNKSGLLFKINSASETNLKTLNSK